MRFTLNTTHVLSKARFLQSIRNAGLEEVAREINYQFKYKHQNLRPFSTLLTSLPVIGPYFTFSLFSVLEKRQ